MQCGWIVGQPAVEEFKGEETGVVDGEEFGREIGGGVGLFGSGFDGAG